MKSGGNQYPFILGQGIKTTSCIAIEQDCPKYEQLLAKYAQESPEVKRIYVEHADQIAYWSEMSGKSLSTTFDIYWLFNTLDIEREQNKTFVHLKLTFSICLNI